MNRKTVENATELIGGTPLLRLNRIAKAEKLKGSVLAKLESFNPARSVKDRVALSLIQEAEKRGLVDKNTVIIEPTSGNTGIGLAMVCAVRGYKLILTMPDSMTVERRNILRGLGAELVLTPAYEGMPGSIRKANELAQQYGKAFIPQQFENPANPEAHRRTTAKEIIDDTDGKVDILVAGVGTGGTITGTGEELKIYNPEIKVVAVEPYSSAVLSGQKPGPHRLQGIGAGFIPKILNTKVYDEIFRVKDKDAFQWARNMAQQEGILVGISSGAALYAAVEIAKRPENKGKNIVVILPDTGDRYLSTTLYAKDPKTV
ncbi:MAG: cysteine synthase A [Bacteroidales bacterium]|nr:cysteine synthase A [Bacteroidales bacterium]